MLRAEDFPSPILENFTLALIATKSVVYGDQRGHRGDGDRNASEVVV